MQQSAYKQILSLKSVDPRHGAVYSRLCRSRAIGGKPTYNYKFQCVVLKGVIGWIVTYLIHEGGEGRHPDTFRLVSLAVSYTKSITV